MLVGVRMYVCMYVVFGKCPCTGIHAFWYNPLLWINQIIIIIIIYAESFVDPTNQKPLLVNIIITPIKQARSLEI